MPVTLDPDAAAIYQAFQDAGRPAYETLTAPEAREYYRNARPVVNPDPLALELNKPLSIPAPHGAIPARIYTPKTLRKRQRPRAVPGVLSRRGLGDRRPRHP